MQWFKETFLIKTPGRGMIPVTSHVQKKVESWNIAEGMCFLFLPHTSASLVLSESYDRDSRADVEAFFDKVAPDAQAWMQHTLEGKDDSASHIRSVLGGASLSIPIENGKLLLGTWQGIFLFEHRAGSHERRFTLRCLSLEESATPGHA